MALIDESNENGVAEALIFMGQFLKRMEEDPEFRAAQEAQVVVGNPISIRPGTPDAATWTQDMIDGAEAKKDVWKRNSLNPSKDPIKECIAAAPYYEARMKEVIDKHLHKAAMEQVKLEDLGAAIEATNSSEYATGISKRKDKIRRKVDKLVTLHTSRKAYVDKTDRSTAANRKKRMNDNLDAMIAIGVAMKTGSASVTVK